MIVITSPVYLKNEVAIINSLFYNGLKVLHIRKPDATIDGVRNLIENIDPEYHSRLALHQHHQLAPEFGINRLHFTEKARQNFEDNTSSLNKDKQWVFSTSVHVIENFDILPDIFEYAFLSPVYDSISKLGYNACFCNEYALKGRTNFSTKLIALGGISSTNCRQALEFGFDDVALLGAIWQAENLIDEFKKCQQALNNYVQ